MSKRAIITTMTGILITLKIIEAIVRKKLSARPKTVQKKGTDQR